MSNTATTQAPQAQATSTSRPDFGQGRYSGLMSEAWSDARRLTNLDDKAAEKFARDLGSDWGRVAPKVTASYGASRSGQTTLKEVATAKGVLETRAITLARLLAEANKLKQLASKSGLLGANVEITIEVDY